jgi:hypothetical protein
MKELTINISKDFSKYPGGRQKKYFQFSGEDFREKFLDENFEKYDKINIELDGVLGYQWDFLDETFGVIARKYDKDQFVKKFNFISRNNHTIEKINLIINDSRKQIHRKVQLPPAQ